MHAAYAGEKGGDAFFQPSRNEFFYRRNFAAKYVGYCDLIAGRALLLFAQRRRGQDQFLQCFGAVLHKVIIGANRTA